MIHFIKVTYLTVFKNIIEFCRIFFRVIQPIFMVKSKKDIRYIVPFWVFRSLKGTKVVNLTCSVKGKPVERLGRKTSDLRSLGLG